MSKKLIMHPDCYNPRCTNKETRCEKCKTYNPAQGDKGGVQIQPSVRQSRGSIDKRKKICEKCGGQYRAGQKTSEKSKYCRPCFITERAKDIKVRKRTARQEKALQRSYVKKRKERVRHLAEVTAANKAVAFLKNDDGTHQFGDNMLTLKNYKEPLRQIPMDEGIGWYGTLAADVTTGKVQCHLCGQLLDALPGHIHSTHKMKTRDYREKFGLSYSTALISERERFRLKKSALDILKDMTPEEREAYKQKKRAWLTRGRGLRSRTQPKKTLEQMNREGSCPDQTLDQILKAKEVLGHVPSKKDFIEYKGGQRFYRLVLKHFGSWAKALEMCKFSEEEMATKPTTASPGHKRRYADEELLEYLRIYAQEYQQVPTYSDWKRDLLPDYKIYTMRFGTIENARQLAGVYEIIAPHKDFMKQSKYYRGKPNLLREAVEGMVVQGGEL